MSDAPILPSGAALCALVESLLFIAPKPVTPGELGKALERPAAEIREALAALEQSLCQDQRGLRLQRAGQTVALVTMPEAAQAVARFTALATHTRLSKPALETLAIVAYQQPVTRGQIEAIRGVDCAHILRALLARELIQIRGRRATIGNPILYGVTEEFLQYFGLTSLAELPDLSETDEGKLADAMVEDTTREED